MLTNSQIQLLYDSLGDKIREERENAKIKQTHFANLINISRASLVNIEKGRQRAPLHILYEIARILKIRVSNLIPDLDQFIDTEVSKSFQEKIEKESAGNKDLEQKLFDFVKSHTTSVKISHYEKNRKSS